MAQWRPAKELLADGIHRYGQAYQAGTQRRSISNFQYAVHLAQSGKLGRLHTLHASVYVPTKNYVPFGNRDPQDHTYTGTSLVRFEGDEGWVETGDDCQIVLSENLKKTLKVQFGGTGLSPAGHGRNFFDCVKSRALPVCRARPSSGAPCQDSPSVRAFSNGRGHAHVAAPEDGRTPPM